MIFGLVELFALCRDSNPAKAEQSSGLFRPERSEALARGVVDLQCKSTSNPCPSASKGVVI